MDVERMCGKPIRLFGTHRDTPNAHSTPSMQHIFTHKKKTCAKTHMYIFNAHTNMIHTWLMPAQYSMDILLTFIPCWGIQIFFFSLSTVQQSFSNSIMHHCVSRVTTLASYVQKIFKNKYQLFTSEAGSNLIFFSTPNQGKVGQSNSKQSKKGARPSNNKLTHRVCIQYSYCCVSLCIFVFLMCMHAAVFTFCFLCVSYL